MQDERIRYVYYFYTIPNGNANYKKDKFVLWFVEE